MAEANARQSRAEETRRERRMKPGQLANPGIHLSVDESMLDRSKFQYRFVNDEGGRVKQLIAQDYDVVQAPDAKPDSNGLGSVASTHGGTDPDTGRPYNQVLMCKHRDWYETDQKAKQKPLDEMDEAIRRGRDHQQNSKLELHGDGVYTPGTNQI